MARAISSTTTRDLRPRRRTLLCPDFGTIALQAVRRSGACSVLLRVDAGPPAARAARERRRSGSLCAILNRESAQFGTRIENRDVARGRGLTWPMIAMAVSAASLCVAPSLGRGKAIFQRLLDLRDRRFEPVRQGPVVLQDLHARIGLEQQHVPARHRYGNRPRNSRDRSGASFR